MSIKQPLEEISIPIVNCELACIYVSALQTPDGKITSVSCRESTTDSSEIRVENDKCLNTNCGHCERR